MGVRDRQSITYFWSILIKEIILLTKLQKMKSIEYPIQLSNESNARSSNLANKRTVFIVLLLASIVGGFFIPVLFVASLLLLVGGFSLYCFNLYKEISNLDFGSDKFSITLEEIIEDLEG